MSIEERVREIEERVHRILYSTASREEIAKRIVALEDLATMEYETLERAYHQPAGFTTHGGIKSSDMTQILEAMQQLGIEVTYG